MREVRVRGAASGSLDPAPSPDSTRRKGRGNTKSSPASGSKDTVKGIKVEPTDKAGGTAIAKTKQIKRKASPTGTGIDAKPQWQILQAVKRELQQCEKVTSAMGVIVKQFQEDHGAVSLSEASQLLKRVERRLHDDFRWVYECHDVEGTATAEHYKRAEFLDRLLLGDSELRAIVGSLRSSGASKDKDPDNYNPDVLRGSISDCKDAGLTVPPQLVQQYASIGVEDALADIEDQVAAKGKELLALLTAQDFASGDFAQRLARNMLQQPGQFDNFVDAVKVEGADSVDVSQSDKHGMLFISHFISANKTNYQTFDVTGLQEQVVAKGSYF